VRQHSGQTRTSDVPNGFQGALGAGVNRRERATATLENISVFCFRSFLCSIRFSKEREMRRVDLVEATMQGWARLNPQQRERFFQAGLKAALRLDRQEFRAWLMRRLIEPPLAAPVDPGSFAISKTDIALLMRSARDKSEAASAAQPRKPPI
jgi:hypothetical protein